MLFMKRILLFFFVALLLGCSRSAPPPQEMPEKAKVSKHVASKKITETEALDILLSALKQHKVADLDCLAFVTETIIPLSQRPCSGSLQLVRYTIKSVAEILM